MKTPLHILHLEDDPRDAALVQSALEADSVPCIITLVQCRDDFVAALEQGGVDLVLSDFSLPAFDGTSALELMRERWPFVPVILVSGTLGEELAIDSMKRGATDYVLKERLSRLVPAVRRAMEGVEVREANFRTEQSLRESEQRFRILFSESPMGIALVGLNGHPVLTNAALQKMLGYSGEEFARMDFTEFTHPDDCAKDIECYQQLVQGGRKDYQLEKRYIRKDGQIISARLMVTTVRDAANAAIFAIKMVEDITERKNLEAQFIEAQKMEVVGHLASGVAHDFNNILAVIMGYSDLITPEITKEKLRTYNEQIRSAAQRAAGLTRQLLVFSRKQTVQPVVLDLKEVVKEIDGMLRRLIDENIEMTIVSGQQLGHVKADPGYVGQVVMNLAINARDAMPNGGKLTIATSNEVLDDNFARVHSKAIPGEYVRLSVTDTGTGMTDNVKAHLFEAFFTTKPKGKGTGLGLATCQTVVQQSGGYICVESEIGKGTTFNVYFPRIQQSVPVSDRLPHNGLLPRGTETLLVVEDDPSVRHLACSVLEAQGYHVLCSANGQDALQVASHYKGEPIRLVITDVIMPLMGGKVMAEWLKTTYPHLKILFTSGYTDDAITQHGVLDAGVEFLPKPYTPLTLAAKVRQILDGK
jgi:two-component system cell cycle sensor histidine kinase/response regulator CckA